MPLTYTLIQSVTVGAGGQTAIDFTSIPATYTDLVVKLSARNTSAIDWYALKFEFNGATTGYTQRLLYGSNGTVYSTSRTDSYDSYVQGANSTASTFTNYEFYVPNYAGSTNKSSSLDWVNENNSSTTYILGVTAGLWSSTAAITSIKFSLETGASFAQYSTAYLYGISKS